MLNVVWPVVVVDNVNIVDIVNVRLL